MQRFRLTRPDRDFFVVTFHERDGRHMATAGLAKDPRDVGVAGTPQEAVRAALRSPGEPYASEDGGVLQWPTDGEPRRTRSRIVCDQRRPRR